jgi:hypothetical protein
MAPTYGSHQDPDERPIVGFKTWLVVAAASLACAHRHLIYRLPI